MYKWEELFLGVWSSCAQSGPCVVEVTKPDPPEHCSMCRRGAWWVPKWDKKLNSDSLWVLRNWPLFEREVTQRFLGWRQEAIFSLKFQRGEVPSPTSFLKSNRFSSPLCGRISWPQCYILTSGKEGEMNMWWMALGRGRGTRKLDTG